MWTKLAANQGNSEAQKNLRAMVSEMTVKELKKARYKVSRFSVKQTKSAKSGQRLKVQRPGIRRGLPGR